MADASVPLQVVITSYNRGRFLAHCVGTVEHCLPYAHVSIRDDESDDPETLRVLDRLEARHTVHRAPGRGNGKHGGLYGHMQAALEAAEPDAPLMYLQDDVQVVRPVALTEISALAALFQAEPTLGFVSPAFIPVSGKGRSPDGDFDFTPETGMFWPEVSRRRSAGVYYSDVNVCLPARLRNVGWQFARREPECDALARQYFRNMAIPALPFVAWLPLVPAYRGKRKTWALRRAEQQRNAGFHPYRLLTPADTERLRARQPLSPPWAEAMLTLRDAALPQPWHHNSLQGRRWLKRLHNAEAALARWFRWGQP